MSEGVALPPGQKSRQLGQPARCMLPEACHDRGRVGPGTEAPEYLEEWQVGLSAAVLLDTLPSPHPDGLPPTQLGHEGVDQRRLSDTRLAGDEDRLTVALPRCLEGLTEPGQLGVAPHAGVEGRGRGLDGGTGWRC